MRLDYKQGVLSPTEKLTLSISPTPAWACEITVDTAGARCASHRKGQAPSEDWLRQYFYPHITKVLSSPPYARHRVSSPKPPSERSQNPKTWGNWEGIGDFCLQKCQRGRQLSPLSEATGLDRNSLRSFRKSIKRRGFAPFGDWLCQFRLSPFFSLYAKVGGDRSIGEVNLGRRQLPSLFINRLIRNRHWEFWFWLCR